MSGHHAVGSPPVRLTTVVIVVMGVSGSGKSTVAAPLAERLGIGLLDADDLHSRGAIDQMHRGVALTGTQRDEWMDRVVSAVERDRPVVLACSALRRDHRSRLAELSGSHLFMLDVPRHELQRRLEQRHDHFFDPGLLDDQLATLEPVRGEEPVVVLDGTRTVDDLVRHIQQTVSSP